MRIYKNQKLIIIVLSIFLILFIVYIWLIQNTKLNLSFRIENSKIIIRQSNEPETIIQVIWWTKIIKNYHQIKQCGYHKCLFTVDRNLINKSEAILFYGSDLEKTDFPLPRLPHHLWGLLHEESPKNVPYLPHNEILQHFNFTSTFSRDSTFPIHMQYLKSIKMLNSPEYLIPIGEKQNIQHNENLASVVFIQSICDTMTGRDEYVRELMNYIKIDSYGKCLHNKDLPEELSNDYLNKIDTPEFYKFIARYKFIISYENGICNDYISEKFWRPLIVGSIPIYFGSKTARDWVPTNNNVIFIDDFQSPKHLANFIKQIDENNYEYLNYLNHKYKMLHPITNQRLLDIMGEREFWTSDNDIGNIFEGFECNICKKLHDYFEYKKYSNSIPVRIANRKHYDCPTKLTFPSMKTNMSKSDWHSIMAIGACQANILDRLLRQNRSFTQKEFNDMLTRDVIANKCDHDDKIGLV